MSLWQEAYEVAEEFSGGSGGGIIAEAIVHNGFWVYVSGLKQIHQILNSIQLTKIL